MKTLITLTESARSFSMRCGSPILSMAEVLRMVKKAFTTYKGVPLYGPFIHVTKNTEDLDSILKGSHLRLNINSGVSGRDDGVYALARPISDEFTKEINSHLNQEKSNVVVFFTTVAPNASPGGINGPHAYWTALEIPGYQLPILPVQSIRSGEISVLDPVLAKILNARLNQILPPGVGIGAASSAIGNTMINSIPRLDKKVITPDLKNGVKVASMP